jgi:hypothetical protein
LGRQSLGRSECRSASHRGCLWGLRRGVRRLCTERTYLAMWTRRADNRRNALWNRAGDDRAPVYRRTLYCAPVYRRSRYCAPVYRRRTRHGTEGLPRARVRAPVQRRSRNGAQEWLRAETQERRRTRRGRTHGLKERVGCDIALRRKRENAAPSRTSGASKPRAGCLRSGGLHRIEICIRVHRLITSLFPRVGNDL